MIGNAFKDKVSLTFSEGSRLLDPKKLFNNMLEGNKWRRIDFLEGDEVNEAALKALVRAAVDRNKSKRKKWSGCPSDRSNHSEETT